MPRGGARKGAGRPKKEPTKRVYVPISLIERVRVFIKQLTNGNVTENKERD